MDETVFAAKEVHESAKVHQLYNLTIVNRADFRLGNDAIDPIDRSLASFSIDRRNLDRAVVFNVDLGAGDFANLANHLTAGADDFTDLVTRNGQRFNAGRVVGHAFTRRVNCPLHLA